MREATNFSENIWLPLSSTQLFRPHGSQTKRCDGPQPTAMLSVKYGKRLECPAMFSDRARTATLGSCGSTIFAPVRLAIARATASTALDAIPASIAFGQRSQLWGSSHTQVGGGSLAAFLGSASGIGVVNLAAPSCASIRSRTAARRFLLGEQPGGQARQLDALKGPSCRKREVEGNPRSPVPFRNPHVTGAGCGLLRSRHKLTSTRLRTTSTSHGRLLAQHSHRSDLLSALLCGLAVRPQAVLFTLGEHSGDGVGVRGAGDIGGYGQVPKEPRCHAHVARMGFTRIVRRQSFRPQVADTACSSRATRSLVARLTQPLHQTVAPNPTGNHDRFVVVCDQLLAEIYALTRHGR
eukprot:scaffold68343_cov63-Phaeocystis_antarctica.AAC.2